MVLESIGISLEHVDQFQGWFLILGEHISFSKTYLNPCRPDRTPGCKFYQKGNSIILMDFSKKTGMDCAQCLMKLKGISYKEALTEIYLGTKNFNPVKHEFEPQETKKCIIETQRKSFTKSGLAYWNDLGVILSQLSRESTRVSQLKSYTLKYEYRKTYYPNDLVFEYLGNDGYKLYFPERVKPRFKSSLSAEDVWVVNNNPNKWIVCKSHKDLLVVEALLTGSDWSFGMVQNEGSYPIKKEWENAHSLLIFFDNDTAGVDAADNFLTYYLNAQAIFIEKEMKCKDISDFIGLYGIEEAKNYLIELINDIYGCKNGINETPWD